MLEVPLTIGIEEEYQIIDPATRELMSYVQEMMGQGRMVLGDQLKQEVMQSQIEVGSSVCQNITEARYELTRLRQIITDLAQQNGAIIAAASTHPFSRWQDQKINEGERYDDFTAEMKDAVRRLLIFGMHVHLGFGKTPEAYDLIIDILNQMRYFLPHILAFSTSSPFWHGRNTGLKSYRSLVFENMPRSGIPPQFFSFAEYTHYIYTMGRVGSLGPHPPSGDPTRIWWDARPHTNWGTLEVRICDMCPRLDDAIAIAALIQALAATLLRLRSQNQSWRIYRGIFIQENKWRAVRYGIEGKLIDFGKQEEVPMADLAAELLEIVDPVLDDLGSRREVEHILTIAQHGTSAERQVQVYNEQIASGATEEDALHAIVDHLIAETHAGWSDTPTIA